MGCSCQHLDCWSTTCADFLNTTNCCDNTPHNYNTLPNFFSESFSQAWKPSACSLYAFASQTYGDETTTLIWTVYQWVVTTEPSSSMRCNGAKRGGGADQVQGTLSPWTTSHQLQKGNCNGLLQRGRPGATFFANELDHRWICCGIIDQPKNNNN